MRSRPKLELLYVPVRPTGGCNLVVEARLESRSTTPIDGIDFLLTGTERHLKGMVVMGTMTAPEYEEHTYVSLGARVPKKTPTPGRHVQRVSFQLPPGIPPSFKSAYTTIAYEL